MASVDVDLIGETLRDSAPIRRISSTAGNVVARVSKGKSLHFTKQSTDGLWYYTTDSSTPGWIESVYVYITYDGNEEKFGTTMTPEEAKAKAEKQEEEKKAAEEEAKKRTQEANQVSQQLSIIEKYLGENSVSDQAIVDSLITNNLNGIYGIPYQFMESVDPRLENSVMGRKYSEKIIAKMPLLCMTPGKVQFMSNFSKSEQSGLLKSLLSGGTETDISNIISNNGRYFTFAFDYAGYFEYVNGMCRAGARFLNIQNKVLQIGDENAVAANFDWSLALNSDLKATFTSQEFVGFYMDSTDSVSESFSNETTPSQLSSTLNGVSDLARELGFLLGAGAGANIQLLDEAQLSKTNAAIDEFTDQYLNGSTLLKNIGKNFSTVAVGGKLLFPEIWSDSQFSRNFDITIKLRTPDADTLSWYLNIYVPLCHLIAFAAGHQTDNPNGYYSPFLVRAFYKGLFNVDMGIVSDMSITKGKEAAWNIDGLPTEIDVNMTIKDLYNMLSIVPGNEPKNFVTNNIMMDYLANTCGININQMDIQRSLEIYYILSRNRMHDLPNKIIRKFQDAIDTYAMNAYNKFQNKFLL